jgi:hypothetical protein
MPTHTWPDRLARAFAIIRGAVLIPYSVMLFIEPEKVMAGSSGEPARTLTLMFASRVMLLGIAFVVLAILGKREWVGGLLLADAALQLFDTGMALMTHKGALAFLPAAIGVIDAWAGLFLLRAARVSQVPPPH